MPTSEPGASSSDAEEVPNIPIFLDIQVSCHGYRASHDVFTMNFGHPKEKAGPKVE
jgi:hypothetical protein